MSFRLRALIAGSAVALLVGTASMVASAVGTSRAPLDEAVGSRAAQAGHPAVHPPGDGLRRAGTTVNVVDFSFSPQRLVAPVGSNVTWTFSDSTRHSTTSSQAAFWDSGLRSKGATYSRVFTSAGTFAYNCTPHSYMTASVIVAVKAAGSPAAGWKLTWATVAGAGATTYDVQMRKPGSTAWTAFRTATRGVGATFNPTRAGTYAVRARTNGSGGRSGWSPVRSLPVS